MVRFSSFFVLLFLVTLYLVADDQRHLEWISVKSFLESSSLDILTLSEEIVEDWIDTSIIFRQMICLQNQNLFLWSFNLFKERTSFCKCPVCWKLWGFLFMLPIKFTSFIILLFFFMVQDPISCAWNDKILLAALSTNVFVFGDFNIHHKDWLSYFDRYDRLFVNLLQPFYLQWSYPDL